MLRREDLLRVNEVVRPLRLSTHSLHNAFGAQFAITTLGAFFVMSAKAYCPSLPVKSWAKDVDQMVCVLAPTGLEKKVHQQAQGVNGVSSHLQL